MKYEIKGDYFNSSFHLAQKSGLDSANEIIEKFSPANIEQKLWECPIEHRNVDKVIDSAFNGFKIWKKVSVEERCNYLVKYRDEINKAKNAIAEAISLETGKPLWEAHGEVQSVINKVDVTISESLPMILSKSYKDIFPNINGTIVYKPIGPCLVIGPFNFPCHLANGQVLAALCAGNSVILKPSEKTIASAQLMIECFDRAKFPPGVINLINGLGETARRLVKSKVIKGVFFTGSREVGKKIIQTVDSDFSKLIALEMGGKNTTIVHQDADIEFAMSELVKACFLTSGQRCTATSKIAIHHSIKDKFIDKFHTLSKNLIIDHPIEFESEPFMGPLIDEHSANNYTLFMGMAKREGAEEIMRGKMLNKKYKGYYVSPSIHYVDSVNSGGHFLKSEIFGPNCVFAPYSDIEEAIQFANSNEYGLAGAVFTADRKIFEKCRDEIDTGIFNLNRSTVGASPKMPFGGVKDSGNYRPAGSFMIQSCVYPMSCLEIENTTGFSREIEHGLKK